MDLSQRYYLHSCKDLHVHPTRSVFEGLVHEKLSCKGNVLMSDDVKAATIALVVGTVDDVVFGVTAVASCVSPSI
ncbi:hypothetical protein DPMN_112826 [Dreissena polymorpha]|uniref:Uncharacterized protein n=1 Tax=Dreissena polymorpha TaxID=45954 RepID=A0A9D4KHV0_DREPO|nr:hypothetical protein DPMN_112826 [Dreissena polymorpha]